MKRQTSSQKIGKSVQQLYYIFTYYCAFGDRENYQILKIQNFQRLLADAQLIQKINQNMELDLLYARAKQNNSGIDFQTFLDIIPDIAQILFGSDQEKGVSVMINQNFHALYEFLYENTELGECIKYLSKSTFSQSCFLLLKSLSSTIYRIYAYYFDINSIKISHKRSQIFKKLTQFTKNFQITPQMLTKTESFIIFNYIADQNSKPAESVYKEWFLIDKNNKNIFTYYHFIQFFMIASLIANRKIIQFEQSQFKKLVNFLEMLEVSAGFSRFCNIQKVNLHLIANQKLIKQLESRNSSVPMFGTHGSHPFNSSPQRKSTSSQLEQIVIQNYSGLHEKFISFCLHGQTIGSSALTHKKTIDIIKHLKLGLKQSQIEVQIASINAKSIQFQPFIMMLQKISEKEHIPMREIMQKFLNITLSQQLQHEKLRSSRNTNLNRTQYKNCIAMVQLLQQFLKTVFMSQAEPSTIPSTHIHPNKNKNLNTSLNSNKYKEAKLEENIHFLQFISLNSYLKIMHEFELSPLYVTKQSLIEIFRKSIKKSYDFMSFYQFKDSFVIAIPYIDVGMQSRMNSHNINSNANLSTISEEKQIEAGPQTKMVVIFQRISQSRKAQKIVKKYPAFRKEEYFIRFRQIFRQFYPEQQQKQRNKALNSSKKSKNNEKNKIFSLGKFQYA